MTKIVSASEARERFSSLLMEIQQGREITILKRGRAVAKSIPVADRQCMTATEAIEGLRKLQSRLKLKGCWKEFRYAGRC